jgi:hypothetical protein
MIALLVIACTSCLQPASGQEASPLRTVHFNINYPPAVTNETAKHVADYLESEYQYLSPSLRLDLLQPLDISIYGDLSSFLSATRQPRPSKIVLHMRGTIHIGPAKLFEEPQSLERSLSYELALALLEGPASRGCPRWLRESFAVYHSAELADLAPPSVVRARYFSDLEQDLAQYPDPPGRDDVHYVLGRTMQFLIERYGQEKVMGIFSVFDGKRPADTVFEAQLGENLETVESVWSNHIRKSIQR